MIDPLPNYNIDAHRGSPVWHTFSSLEHDHLGSKGCSSQVRAMRARSIMYSKMTSSIAILQWQQLYDTERGWIFRIRLRAAMPC